MQSNTASLGLDKFNTMPDPLVSRLVSPGLVSEQSNSPFKSCIIEPTSKSFSQAATYRMSGQAETWDSESTNYTISKSIRFELNYKDNKLTGSVETGYFTPKITTDEITTTCINGKDFRTISSLSSIKVAPQSNSINPPFNSCPSGFDIKYIISGTFNNLKENKIIKLDNPTEIVFESAFRSDFETGELGNGYLRIGSMEDNFKIDSLYTHCIFSQ